MKHSELISINVSKQSHREPGALPTSSSPSNEDQLSALHETELEKQLNHQSPIVHQVILENLLKLDGEADLN